MILQPSQMGGNSSSSSPQPLSPGPRVLQPSQMAPQLQTPSPTTSDQTPQGNNFFQNLIDEPLKTLVAQPITRAVQAVKALGGDETAGTQDTNLNIPLLGNINIPAQKTGGAGLEQIGGDALKTGAYLAPGLGEGSIATQTGKNALAGAAFGAGNEMQQGGSAGDVLKAGGQGAAIGGAIGGSSALVAAGLEKLQPILEKENLKTTASQAAKYQGIREGADVSRLSQAIDVGVKMPGITPATKMQATLDTIQSAENAIDATIKSPAMQEVAGYLPTKNVTSAFETASREPGVTPDLAKKLISQGEAVAEQNPDYTTLSYLQDQKKAWGSKGYGPGGIVTYEEKAAYQNVYKKLIEDSLDKVGAEVQVPPEIKAIHPNLPDTLPIKQFNQAYGPILDYKGLLGAAMKKSEVGFVKKMAAEAGGYVLGNTIGGPLGGIAGGVAAEQLAENAPVSAVRTLAGKAANSTARVVRHIPKVAMPIYGSLSSNKGQP